MLSSACGVGSGLLAEMHSDGRPGHRTRQCSSGLCSLSECECHVAVSHCSTPCSFTDGTDPSERI